MLNEVTSELVHGNDDSSTVALKTTTAVLTEVLAPLTCSVMPLVAVTELANGTDNLAADALSSAAEHTTELIAVTSDSDCLPVAVTEVRTELVDDDNDLATAIPSTTVVDNIELIDDLTTPRTGSATPLATVTEVITKLVNGNDDLALVMPSRDGEHTTDTEVDSKLAALTPDSDCLPAATEVTSELLLASNDFSPAVLRTDEAGTKLTDHLTAPMTGADTITPAALTEDSIELVHGDITDTELTDKLTAVTSDSVALPAAATELTSELVHGSDNLAIAVLSLLRAALSLAGVDDEVDSVTLMPDSDTPLAVVTVINGVVDGNTDLAPAV